MNSKQILSYVFTCSLIAIAILLYLMPNEIHEAVALTTSTITGWNVPSGTTFGNGLIALILPLTTMGIFAGIPLLLEYRGDLIVTMALMGLFLGSLIGMLSLTSTNATNVPFALVIVSGLFLGLWLWKGGS